MTAEIINLAEIKADKIKIDDYIKWISDIGTAPDNVHNCKEIISFIKKENGCLILSAFTLDQLAKIGKFFKIGNKKSHHFHWWLFDCINKTSKNNLDK